MGGALAQADPGVLERARSSWSCKSTESSWIAWPRPPRASQEQLAEIARGSGKLAARLNGREIVKAVVVPGKLVNFVVK